MHVSIFMVLGTKVMLDTKSIVLHIIIPYCNNSTELDHMLLFFSHFTNLVWSVKHIMSWY